MEIVQDILILLLVGYMTIDQNGPVVMSWFGVIVGMIAGLIMGDMNTGLVIGGTFQLMSLGVAAMGGSSVPNYGLATIVGTFIAVRTGAGIDAAIAVGLPVGLLGIQLEVIVRIINNFTAHKMQVGPDEPPCVVRPAALLPADPAAHAAGHPIWLHRRQLRADRHPGMGHQRPVHCGRYAAGRRCRYADALHAH